MRQEFSERFARALGYLAAATLIACSAAQNALHGHSLGLRTSEVTAIIFAAASIAGAIMAPISLAAAFKAFRRFEIGTGLVALTLAAGTLSYALTCSVGFVAGAKDQAIASRAAEAESYKLAKLRADAAGTELKVLAATPTGNRKIEAAKARRRGELEAIVAAAEKAMSAGGAISADPTAAALAVYAAALGWSWSAEAIGQWLTLLCVGFFEVAAATSLIVMSAFAQRPVGSVPAPAAASQPSDVPTEDADGQDAKRPGRKRNVTTEKVMERLAAEGGKIEGSFEAIGERLGLSKSSAHRTLHELAGAGLVTLATSAAGTLVQAR